MSLIFQDESTHISYDQRAFYLNVHSVHGDGSNSYRKFSFRGKYGSGQHLEIYLQKTYY